MQSYHLADIVIIQIKVKPNSRESTLTEENGQWSARLKARPVDGRANAELIALVARHFSCPKSSVSIKTGTTGKTKLVHIAT